ncbi:MAG: 2,3-bisphosphoglycerate-independent phosphoglycerate mutase [Candidatus Berkelbacteria bacterium Athens1014_28]|uniref:2,3-bisphosphoglycerate-independent phosphoglycerate mutase n=1 Tax=Candidatus Berkelbacteria bacterium Athens1014_28 TaxID=2017145 RepID=A0A554LJQ3_9BACT|nr:MAG: 2,3-bisphosphoglycerate-independent phosphoglycerate mutase [Candidatus Berkelbacteria bacterium Athens1014_28]
MKKVLLVILDGWGLSPIAEGNATFLAKTPNLDYLYKNYPKTSLSASGLSVGITPGEPGNSEVGHLNIGSGRVVWENLPRIDQAIDSGEFFQNRNLKKFATDLKNSDGALHLIGLCSTGGIHSHLSHLYALLEFAEKENIKNVYLHLITDGRDTAPKVALEDVVQINNHLKKLENGKIASVIGRFYAMDRDKHNERTQAAYNLWTLGKGRKFLSAEAAIKNGYLEGKDDENLEASVIDEKGIIKPEDGLAFFNFRSDRMRQILSVFEDESFSGFSREKLSNLKILTMTSYQNNQKSPEIFPPLNLSNTLPDVIETAGLSQFHTAETEKFAHVTYFFNGGDEKVHQKEKQVIVPSPRVESYDYAPEMSAKEVKNKVVEALKNDYQFILVNFANGDMVGHTGRLPAAIKACEEVDRCLFDIMSAASGAGYVAIITADHGNCEMMKNLRTGEIDKEHTSNPVPLVFADFSKSPFLPQNGVGINKNELLQYSSQEPTGILADIAPTILAILNISNPKEMTGKDLQDLI